MSKVLDVMWFTQARQPYTIGIVMVKFEPFEQKEPRCYIGAVENFTDEQTAIKFICENGAKFRMSDLGFISQRLHEAKEIGVQYRE